MYYKFIGDEDDAITRLWGIRFGKVYKVETKQNSLGEIKASIFTEEGEAICPYGSVKAFNKNWQHMKLYGGTQNTSQGHRKP